MASPPRDPHRSNAVSAGDVKQARLTHDKSGGHPIAPTEVKSRVAVADGVERAREDGNFWRKLARRRLVLLPPLPEQRLGPTPLEPEFAYRRCSPQAGGA